jgi:nucleoside-diphosphate-sugar epimerase
MHVLVTGAGGFIGSHLVDDQLQRGNKVTALDLNTSYFNDKPSHPNLTVITSDFADFDWNQGGSEEYDICFHLASAHLETDVDEHYFHQVNVVNLERFVKRCQEAGVKRFVHCSSVGVYGNIQNPPANEESPLNPDVAYERSKLEGEKVVIAFSQQTGYPVVIIRPAWVYGPRCPRTERLFRTIKKGRFFFVGSGKTLRHPIYISDMTEGFYLAATNPKAIGGTFIIAGPKAVTLEDLASEIAQVENVKSPNLRLPEAPVWLGCLLLEGISKVTKKKAPFTRRSMKFYTGNTAFDISKAREEIGFNPQVELSEGLKLMYTWLIENHRINP